MARESRLPGAVQSLRWLMAFGEASWDSGVGGEGFMLWKLGVWTEMRQR